NPSKIATDVIGKTAEMGKAAVSMANTPENAGEIAKDVATKSAKSGMNKTTQIGQQAGQGM
ncbi:MAG: hypothetical protein FWB84_03650, partial [Candidatus Bathyarchaeota archaeon]|uniref:hypothetical protein n=1 Tax=Candidatus Bathycorpusculum sp. TaxID=2994959 RepID=UPI00281D7683|nr:hypothetical protein [Candidatus Termiticorpusculum sp.]